MISVDIYEQDLHGRTHFRVMRADGRLIFDRQQTDFDSEQDAVSCLRGEPRRNHMGECRITIHLIDRQANGRRLKIKTIYLDDCGAITDTPTGELR